MESTQNYDNYKDYRQNPTQEDCKIFNCECDKVSYRVVAGNSSEAINILRKHIKGKAYHAKWNGKYFISMLNNESDAILK